LRVELYLAFDRRKKLEAPPAYRVEMPTYWKAPLEPINPEELGRYQFHRLVQDAAVHQGRLDRDDGPEVSLLDQNKSLFVSRALRLFRGWHYAERQITDRWGRQRVFRRDGVPESEFS
jgi:hypothetical protein